MNPAPLANDDTNGDSLSSLQRLSMSEALLGVRYHSRYPERDIVYLTTACATFNGFNRARELLLSFVVGRGIFTNEKAMFD